MSAAGRLVRKSRFHVIAGWIASILGMALGNNVNFGNGFNTVTLATFTDQGTLDLFRIINGGTGNSRGRFLASRSQQCQQCRSQARSR